MKQTKKIIAVIGDSNINEGSLIYKTAYELGKLLIDRGYRIQTGGLGGVMEAAMKGARSSPNYHDGDTIAIIPSFNKDEANEYADIVIPTGLDVYRNAVVVNADAVIALGGGSGTLSEIAIAWQLFKLIIAFNNLGGWSETLADTPVDGRIRYNDIPNDRVYGVATPIEALNVLNNYIDRYTRIHTQIKDKSDKKPAKKALKPNKIGIIGYGHVGKAMHETFKDAIIYDEPLGIGSKEEINKCNTVFICVPTPMLSDGGCDTSIVEDVISWLKVHNIIISSTVEVGFTDRMIDKYHKNIAFHPEYFGETANHPYSNISNRSWAVFGGSSEACIAGKEVYLAYTDVNHIEITGAKEAELAKYMENAFLATKVIFSNVMYDIAEKLNVDFKKARELWLLDSRIGESHTIVYPNNRGYGGSCFPKDISSLIHQGADIGVNVDLLKEVVKTNDYYHSRPK